MENFDIKSLFDYSDKERKPGFKNDQYKMTSHFIFDKKVIDFLLNNPYEKIYPVIENDNNIIIEEFRYISKTETEVIEGLIECGYASKHKHPGKAGDVEIKIKIDSFINEHRAAFGDLQVYALYRGKGVGKDLMKEVINVIKVLKQYFSITETISLCGWLSIADKENGNWKISVPFYETVAKSADVGCVFTFKNHQYTATEFLKIADGDGNVVFLI